MAKTLSDPPPKAPTENLKKLGEKLQGDLEITPLYRRLYATDASVYQETPMGVAFPAVAEDLKRIVDFCRANEVAMIPRAGGTSLAGQCVGSGLVVDVSRHLNKIIHFDAEQKTVTVQPGIIRDELNAFLETHGLFFAPITSTANRATIGGMVGNNSCGTNSIVYGDTRRYVQQIKGVLHDGSEVVFAPLDRDKLAEVKKDKMAMGTIYRAIFDLLADPELATDLDAHFPKATVTRRNTGYALDALYEQYQRLLSGETFNLSPLIAGSEGTLVLLSEITLKLQPLPPPVNVVAVCPFSTIHESMRAVTQVMQHQPYACELMDRIILNCTRGNLKYEPTLQHIPGDPAAVLLVEFRAETLPLATSLAKKMIDDLSEKQLGYGSTIVSGATTKDIWALRSAGLGLLANIPGDKKGVACIEDTAVAIEDLADYMSEFAELMTDFDQEVVYYAHAGAGEIHLRPILNLKAVKDRQLFHDITLAVAKLVKKYRGSLSGEHGDGRVRAPFLPLMVGEANYLRFELIKQIFDPNRLFNPGKIVDAPSMNEDLRYAADAPTPAFSTVFDFSATEGILRLAEKCNGSGDCRKLPLSGGTMCPSYQATRNEKDTTRGRANVLRQVLTENAHENPFAHPDLKIALDLCLSCKGCTAECPSNVDMATLKAEVTHHRHKSEGVPLRSKVFAHIATINKLGSWWPGLTNFMLSNALTGSLVKKLLNIAPKRSLPQVHKPLIHKQLESLTKPPFDLAIYLFQDEFTAYNDGPVGRATVELLNALGYEIRLMEHAESGRAAISKGLLDYAKKCAETNVNAFADLVTEYRPLVGIEPSAILSFRDEYPKLVRPELRPQARKLAANCLTLEEFLVREMKAFRINSNQFDTSPRKMVVHGHCHQKALTDFKDVYSLLSLPAGHLVSLLDTGCCGMAGSFGYEAEHYELSMQIGELRLFPAVRRATEEEIIVAAGTSCRHQILDGTGRRALHPAEILLMALSDKTF